MNPKGSKPCPCQPKGFARSPGREFLSQGKTLIVLLNSMADTQKSCLTPQQLFPFSWQHAANFRRVWHFWSMAEELQKYSEYSWVHIEGIFFIMLVGWISYLIRNSFNEKLLKLNVEDKSHFTQGGKPTQGSTCQNWPPLCTISHILQTSPRSWSKVLFCTDKLHVTLKANITFPTVQKLHLYEAAVIQLPLSSPNPQRSCQLEMFVTK